MNGAKYPAAVGERCERCATRADRVAADPAPLAAGEGLASCRECGDDMRIDFAAWVSDAVEILHRETRSDSLIGSTYCGRPDPRGDLEDAAESYLRGLRFPREVVRQAARRYAADELAYWQGEDEGGYVYHVDAWPG